MIETSFFEYLQTLTDMTVYPQVLPHNQDRGITYAVAQGEREQTFHGVSSLQPREFDVDCWSKRYTDAREQATAITVALVGYRGPMGVDYCDNVILVRDLDTFENETELHRAGLSFRLFYRA